MCSEKMFWFCVALLLCSCGTVRCLVWSLVLGNPVVDAQHPPAGAAVEEEEENRSLEHINHPRNIHKIAKPARHHHGDKERCLEDRQCGKGRFCDMHYGLCRTERSPGFACRRDRMCARGLHCMFGRCQARIPHGEDGARCADNSDCQPGLCCARRHGEAVCQRKLSLGHRCYVPDGGLEYSLNEMCPCDDGLICRELTELHQQERNYTSTETSNGFPFWTTTDHMRCQPLDSK